MYPIDILTLFPPFPRENKVFVAMSFADEFQPRWENVIAPAIESVEVDGDTLQAHRVDNRKVSDSIVTEIVTGISNSRLIFADISSHFAENRIAVRNGNVMYEVGIAHAVRLPEEVLLFRSDRDPLLFDVANVRINRYDPEGQPEEARQGVEGAIRNALLEVDNRRNLSVQRTLDSLDFQTLGVLLAINAQPSGITPPKVRTMRDVMNAVGEGRGILRVLELGLVRAVLVEMGNQVLDMDADAEDNMRYRITPFGKAVVEVAYERFGTAALQREIERLQRRIQEL
jgi:hypothetical protein